MVSLSWKVSSPFPFPPPFRHLEPLVSKEGIKSMVGYMLW